MGGDVDDTPYDIYGGSEGSYATRSKSAASTVVGLAKRNQAQIGQPRWQ